MVYVKYAKYKQKDLSMSCIKIKVPYKNPITGSVEMRDGVDVGFATKTPEPWIEYELEDGTIIRLRQTLSKAIRIENETNPVDGSPVYVIEAQGSMSVGKKIK